MKNLSIFLGLVAITISTAVAPAQQLPTSAGGFNVQPVSGRFLLPTNVIAANSLNYATASQLSAGQVRIPTRSTMFIQSLSTNFGTTNIVATLAFSLNGGTWTTNPIISGVTRAYLNTSNSINGIQGLFTNSLASNIINEPHLIGANLPWNYVSVTSIGANYSNNNPVVYYYFVPSVQ